MKPTLLLYINARDGGKPTPRRKKDVQKDGKISTFRDMLEHINDNGEPEPQITLETYIKRVNSILFIAVKRPRNARVESDDDEEPITGDNSDDEINTITTPVETLEVTLTNTTLDNTLNL